MAADALACPSCGRSLETASVIAAAVRWSRSVFGAPRNFESLVVSVEAKDEVFERILTEIVRREIREERIVTRKSSRTSARLNPRTVDPFSISVAELRSQSEYVADCAECRSAGEVTCSGCSGSGRAQCPGCRGSGQELRQYKKSSRWIKCTVCRGKGQVICQTCIGRGRVACSKCEGSGCQLAWLTYDQKSRSVLSIKPQSPVLRAHPQLSAERPIDENDISLFSVLENVEDRGPLLGRISDELFPGNLEAQTAALDTQLERVGYQQYIRFAAKRRDVTYEMCGTQGTVVLSGTGLVGSRTREAVRPIEKRLFLWLLATLAALFAAMMALGSVLGAAQYFVASNRWMTLFWGVAVIGTTLIAGAFLREVRPRLKFGGFSRFEKYVTIASALAVAAMSVVWSISRPKVDEARQSLNGSNIPRAKIVVEALKEVDGDTAEILRVEDEVLLREARSLTGESKLQLLDAVARRNGPVAAVAAGEAREERLTTIRLLNESKASADSIARIDAWFPSSVDPEVVVERARAYDIANEQCGDDVCRFMAATQALQVKGSPERTERLGATRKRLSDALFVGDIAEESPLSRLQRLRTTSDVATKVIDAAKDDAPLLQQATQALSTARDSRLKVPLIGANEVIVEELVGEQIEGEGPVSRDGMKLFFVFDPKRRCTGVYFVGISENSRPLSYGVQGHDGLLSQALGQEAKVKAPKGQETVTRWAQGGIPVVARWKGATLMELRVGNAVP